jgi:hypothetical protein
MLGVLRKLDIGQDRQSVDDDALGNRLIPRVAHVAPRIVGTVAGYIDGAPLGLERRLGDLPDGEIDAARDGRAVEEGSRCLRDQVGEAAGTDRSVEDAPIDDEPLLAGGRPVDEADRYPLVRPDLIASST